jgi:hypothetical protein
MLIKYCALVTFVVHTYEQLYTAQRKETNTPKNIHQTHNMCAQQKFFFSNASSSPFRAQASYSVP